MRRAPGDPDRPFGRRHPGTLGSADGNHATYAKWISVALEHENSGAHSYETMNKLQLFNTPLKVLITYAAEGTDADSLLRKYERIMAAADVFNDFANLRQQLVILGTPKTVGEWRFYQYECDGFVLMLPPPAVKTGSGSAVSQAGA
jgi:hypothetical protein